MDGEQMKGKIEDAVQKQMDGMQDFCIDDYEIDRISNLDRYKLRCADRLCKYVRKYRSGKIGLKDLLVSLRTYLLTNQSDLLLPSDIETAENEFGLRLDGH